MSKKNVMQIKDGIDTRHLGCLVKRIIHPETTGSKNLSVSICYINPGEEVIQHRHEYEEAYFVLEGEGTMTLEDEIIHLEKNLSIYISENSIHGQKNDGNVPLILLCSLAPPPIIEK